LFAQVNADAEAPSRSDEHEQASLASPSETQAPAVPLETQGNAAGSPSATEPTGTLSPVVSSPADVSAASSSPSPAPTEAVLEALPTNPTDGADGTLSTTEHVSPVTDGALSITQDDLTEVWHFCSLPRLLTVTQQVAKSDDTVSSEKARKATISAFRYFDRNGTGYLKREDAEAILHALDAHLSRRFIHSIVTNACDPHNEKLPYPELVSRQTGS
jgi:hypothetical protein